MDPDILSQAYKAVQKHQNCCLVTVIEATLKGTPQKSGAKMIVFDDGAMTGTIGGGRNERAAIKTARRVIKHKKPLTETYDYFGQTGQSVCGGQMRVFFEPIIEKDHFILCGGGHIGLPLSVLAKMLNFHVTLIDNRRSFASAKRFPHVDRRLCLDYTKALEKTPITPETYIMVVTQGNEFDYACLKAVLGKPAAYIGCISSKAKKIKFRKRLKDDGFKMKAIQQIHIPAGTDLGAQTPEEIALSIAAEILKIRNKNAIGTAKFQ